MVLPPLSIMLFKKKLDWHVPKKNFGNHSESQDIPFAQNIKTFLYRQGCLSSSLGKRVLCITGNVCKFWQDGDIITTKLYKKMAIIFSSYISTKATTGATFERVVNNVISKLGKEQMEVGRGSFSSL